MLLMTVCCGRRSHDPRLERIWEYVSDKPRAALAALDSIDAAKLSDSDRAFYNLISIKAKDKAYVRHTSDSLILTVIDYYNSHNDEILYPEALYYGGRVYYDLGDYPTSLRYFQDALDLLPEDTPNLRLRGNVLSQAGGLLNDLGLYYDAIPYLQNVLKSNIEMNDTLNTFFNYKLLGAIYNHLMRYEDALDFFNKADNLSEYVPKEYAAEIQMYKAAIYYYCNDISNALNKIRPITQQTDSLSRNLVLSFASKIYHKAGVLDTAYMYAHELALSDFLDNRKSGYMVMLSPEIKKMIPSDSLDFFFDDYKRVLETTFMHQVDNHALIQNAMYNYELHDRQKQEAIRSRDRILIYVVTLIAIISILIAFILWLLYSRKSYLVKLHDAMSKLHFIEIAQKADNKESEAIQKDNYIDEVIEKKPKISQIIKDENTLKEELRNKYRIIKEKSESYDISTRILTSRPYIRLQSLLKSQLPLPNEHNIFVELENVVSECYPDFKYRLMLLADGDLKADELQLCMLIRCGFSPKELSVLLGRVNSTITYKRKKLCKKLLGEELDLEIFGAVIRSL